MIFQKGNQVLYKGKYIGWVRFVFEENKTYMVYLTSYRGGVDRQCEQNELFPYEQISLT